MPRRQQTTSEVSISRQPRTRRLATRARSDGPIVDVYATMDIFGRSAREDHLERLSVDMMTFLRETRTSADAHFLVTLPEYYATRASFITEYRIDPAATINFISLRSPEWHRFFPPADQQLLIDIPTDGTSDFLTVTPRPLLDLPKMPLAACLPTERATRRNRAGARPLDGVVFTLDFPGDGTVATTDAGIAVPPGTDGEPAVIHAWLRNSSGLRTLANLFSHALVERLGPLAIAINVRPPRQTDFDLARSARLSLTALAPVTRDRPPLRVFICQADDFPAELAACQPGDYLFATTPAESELLAAMSDWLGCPGLNFESDRKRTPARTRLGNNGLLNDHAVRVAIRNATRPRSRARTRR